MKVKILFTTEQTNELIERLKHFPVNEVEDLLGEIVSQYKEQIPALAQFDRDLEKFTEEWEFKPQEPFFGRSLVDLLRKATEEFDEENAKRTDEFVKKPVKRRSRPAAKKRGRPAVKKTASK